LPLSSPSRSLSVTSQINGSRLLTTRTTDPDGTHVSATYPVPTRLRDPQIFLPPRRPPVSLVLNGILSSSSFLFRPDSLRTASHSLFASYEGSPFNIQSSLSTFLPIFCCYLDRLIWELCENTSFWCHCSYIFSRILPVPPLRRRHLTCMIPGSFRVGGTPGLSPPGRPVLGHRYSLRKQSALARCVRTSFPGMSFLDSLARPDTGPCLRVVSSLHW